jgi:GT2 family glycosyltransferase
VIALPNNLGFGAANNRALTHVRTPFALLLNPDCEISPDAIQQLLKTAAVLPQAAIVAPQLLQANGAPEINYRWPQQHWQSLGPAVTVGPACVGFICGAAMLLRMSAFGDTFFDEQFFLYYEDDDLCTRLFNQRKTMVIDPAASEYIRGYHHAQSKLIYAAKHESFDTAKRLRQKLLWQTALALPLRVLLFSPKLIARMLGRMLGVTRWDSSRYQ